MQAARTSASTGYVDPTSADVSLRVDVRQDPHTPSPRRP